jgi:hypothetical protein
LRGAEELREAGAFTTEQEKSASPKGKEKKKA